MAIEPFRRTIPGLLALAALSCGNSTGGTGSEDGGGTSPSGTASSSSSGLSSSTSTTVGTGGGGTGGAGGAGGDGGTGGAGGDGGGSTGSAISCPSLSTGAGMTLPFECAPVCPSPSDVPTTLTSPGEYSVPTPNFSIGDQVPPAGCSPPEVLGRGGAPFRLDTEAQVTVAQRPQIGQFVGAFALRCACEEPDFACAAGINIFSKRLAPGDYYLAMNEIGEQIQANVAVDVYVEPPPPPTTNFDCVSATPLTITNTNPFIASHSEPRVVSGTPDPDNPGRHLRYYTVTTPEIPAHVEILSSTPAGYVEVSWRIMCSDPASEINTTSCGAYHYCMAQGDYSWVPAGTYALVVSAQEGMDYTVSLVQN